MFWLSLLCGLGAFLGTGVDGNVLPTLGWLAWLGFGAVWLYLCFLPKYYT